MVYPEPCEELRRRPPAIYGWEYPLQTFIYPVSIVAHVHIYYLNFNQRPARDDGHLSQARQLGHITSIRNDFLPGLPACLLGLVIPRVPNGQYASMPLCLTPENCILIRSEASRDGQVKQSKTLRHSFCMTGVAGSLQPMSASKPSCSGIQVRRTTCVDSDTSYRPQSRSGLSSSIGCALWTSCDMGNVRRHNGIERHSNNYTTAICLPLHKKVTFSKLKTTPSHFQKKRRTKLKKWQLSRAPSAQPGALELLVERRQLLHLGALALHLLPHLDSTTRHRAPERRDWGARGKGEQKRAARKRRRL